ncbi:hypothetical protein [Thiomonas sp.]|jgi:hypothetical protein|uniref:hypothetical protein n=1 Tax=Thiomonas sp. TaxID=2047785 RepID=UPI002616F541|nr:hypothetical protein [Thiomonas sp.]
MKRLHEFDHDSVHRLISDEGWDRPMAEVTQVRLSASQQAVFWGLRAYVVVMTGVVVWAFVHGAIR